MEGIKFTRHILQLCEKSMTLQFKPFCRSSTNVNHIAYPLKHCVICCCFGDESTGWGTKTECAHEQCQEFLTQQVKYSTSWYTLCSLWFLIKNRHLWFDTPWWHSCCLESVVGEVTGRKCMGYFWIFCGVVCL